MGKKKPLDQRDVGDANKAFYANAAAELKRKRPDLSPEIIDDIAALYTRQSGIIRHDKHYLKYEREQSGLPLPNYKYRHKQWKIENDSVENIINTVKRTHGDAGLDVLRAYERQVKPPGVLDGIVKQFYDPDNKGLQLDGLAGAAIGGLVTWSLVGSAGGANSWLALAGIALGAVVGAWAANSTVDVIKPYVTFGKGKQKGFQPSGEPDITIDQTLPVHDVSQNKNSIITPEVAQQAAAALKPKPVTQTPPEQGFAAANVETHGAPLPTAAISKANSPKTAISTNT